MAEDHNTTIPPTRATAVKLLRLPAVEAMAAMKKSKLYDLVKQGQFPAPVRLGPRSVRWKSTDVQAWIDNLETDATGKGGER